MHIVFVYVQVVPELVDEFIEATQENADYSRQEAGIVRFDLYQQKDDRNKFLLLEYYKAESDQALHKETDHYKKWKDKVASMMAQPRSGIPYTQIY